ncbi:MAG: hypothetical protein IIB41_04030 [Candidatus Marinimicrobia bacterium]|nr:hypothetical protein [Candidatus Neomarinimicrobiota bacterium]
MSDDKVMNRLDELIKNGEAVLATKRSSDMGSDSVSNDIFHQWRVESLSFLQAAFGDSGIFFTEFKEKCKDSYHHHAEEGLAILNGAKSELDSGDIF